MSSVGKVLGQLAIVLVHTRTVLKTKYKTQFFKDSPVSIVLHPKAIVLNCTRGDIQRMSSIGPRLHSRWRGQLPSMRTIKAFRRVECKRVIARARGQKAKNNCPNGLTRSRGWQACRAARQASADTRRRGGGHPGHWGGYRWSPLPLRRGRRRHS